MFECKNFIQYCSFIGKYRINLFILVFKVFANTSTEHVLRATAFDIGTICIA